MEIQHVAVVGAGQMGSGIAQTAATFGLDVILIDQNPAIVAKSLDGIKVQLDRMASKGKLTTAEAQAAFGRLRPGRSTDDAAQCDFAVEAVVENETIKKKVHEGLAKAMRETAIIASNTSSIPITRLAAAVPNPKRVIGMHFMHPVPVLTLVEIIPAIQTADETFQATQALARRMGKTTVVSKDLPGFIVNRILIPMVNEACFVLQEGLASAEDIDTAMKLGTNQPMGPLTLADFIGLDTCLSIAEVLHRGFGEGKYRPSPLLRQYVEAGWLGRKTGRGFFKY
jgi:3-hydroxybutyryl-CoA dehydrogenase